MEFNNEKKNINFINNIHDYEIAFLRIDGYVDKFPQIIPRKRFIQQHSQEATYEN